MPNDVKFLYTALGINPGVYPWKPKIYSKLHGKITMNVFKSEKILMSLIAKPALWIQVSRNLRQEMGLVTLAQYVQNIKKKMELDEALVIENRKSHGLIIC